MTNRTDGLADVFDAIPEGIFTVSDQGRLLVMNTAGHEILFGGTPPPSPLRCCDIVCDRVVEESCMGAIDCFTEEALRRGGPTEELEVALDPEQSDVTAWISATPLGPDAGVLFNVRPEQPGRTEPDVSRHDSPGMRMRIFSFGQTRVENATRGSMTGQWMDQRPGQILKYLICSRHRTVTAEELAQAFWPDSDARALSSVRYSLHTLRSRLEPSRRARAPSRFIDTARGGYSLSRRWVWTDASEFEGLIAAGFASLASGNPDGASRRLDAATNLYRGDFLADEPYATWALTERDRLQDLAAKALRALSELALDEGELESAARHARRLAELEPYDNDAQLRHIEICLRRGRRTEAVRRYKLFRQRLERDFGVEPDFTLADLSQPGD